MRDRFSSRRNRGGGFSLQPAAGAMTYTVSAWLNTDNVTNWRTAVGTWFSPSSQSMHFGLDSSRRASNYVFVDGVQRGIVDTATAVLPGQWYHMASVVDKASQSLQFWVNGRNTVNIPLATWSTTQTPGTRDVYIGTKDAGGWKDDLAANSGTAQFVPGRVGNALRMNVQAGDVDYVSEGITADVKLHSSYTIEAWINPSTTAHDSSPNTGVHNGTYSGAALDLPSGVRGTRGNTAAYFDGNDYVNMGDIDGLDGLAAVTAEAWVRWDGTPNTTGSLPGSIVRKQNPGSVFALGAGWDTPGGNAARFWVSIPGLGFVNSGDGTTNVADGEWHYVVGTYDSSFVRVYVDGVEESSAAYSGTLVSDNSPLWIGAYPGEAWTGMIDEVAVYTRALSPGEITSHYQAGMVPEPSTLVLAALGALGLAAFGWRRRCAFRRRVD